MRASGCGGGNTGKPDSAKTFLPEREKISTPVAASFNLNGRDVNIYEYTGLTFNNQSLWTKSLAVTDDTIYFFGTDRSDPVYQTKLRSVHYKGETLSDLKDLDPQADMRDHLMISNGLVYEFLLKGDYKKKKKKGDRPSWHYYDGTQVVPTDLKNMIASIDGSKDVIYDRGKEYWTGTLDKGQTKPALTPYLMVPMKNDSILSYREVSGTEVKLYRMDL